MIDRKLFLIRLGVYAVIITILFLVIGLAPLHGNGMYPALRDGDLLVTLKLNPQYRCGVVCLYENPNGEKNFGRILAVGGEKVDIDENGRLLVNGSILSEDSFYPTKASKEKSSVSYPYRVPAGCFFILNDYRSDQNDSRLFGAIPSDKLKGRALALFRGRGF